MIEPKGCEIRAEWATALMALNRKPAGNAEWATALSRWSFFVRRHRERGRVCREACSLRHDRKQAGGATALPEPGDELAQSRRVRGELAHGVGAVGRGIDADPVAGIADGDAGGLLVADRLRCQFGAGFGAGALGDACRTGQVGRGLAWRRRTLGRCVDDGGGGRGLERLLQEAGVGVVLADGYGSLQDSRETDSQGERRPAEESTGAPAVPTGSTGAAVPAWRRSSPNEWAENAPQPNRTSGPSAKARGTIDVTGSDAGRRSRTYTAPPQVPGTVAQGFPARPANPPLQMER